MLKIKKILKKVKILCLLLSYPFLAFGIFITVAQISSGIQNKNVFLSHKTFNKLHVKADSLSLYSTASRPITIKAFSNELNNCKIPIGFFPRVHPNKLVDFYNALEAENNYIYIWYRPESELAFYGRKEENSVLDSYYLHQFRNWSIFGAVLLILGIIGHRIIRRYFKKWKEEEKKLVATASEEK